MLFFTSIAATWLAILFVLGAAGDELSSVPEKNGHRDERESLPGLLHEDALSGDQRPLLGASSSLRRRSVIFRRAPNDRDSYGEAWERLIQNYADALEQRLGFSKCVAGCVARGLFGNARNGIREPFGPVKILRKCRITCGEATEADYNPYLDYYLDDSRRRDSTVPEDVDANQLTPWRSPPPTSSDGQPLNSRLQRTPRAGHVDFNSANGPVVGGMDRAKGEKSLASELGNMFSLMKSDVQKYFGGEKTRPGLEPRPLLRNGRGLVPVRGGI